MRRLRVGSVSERAELSPQLVCLVEEVCLVCLVRRTGAIDQLIQNQPPDFAMKLTCFEDLDCWKEARQLTRQVYEVIEQSPAWKRDVRLCSQIQSAGGSVMANIAEGFVRRSNKEFMQFLYIAMSSSAEVKSHLYITVDQGYLSKDAFASIYAQADKAGRIISGLITYLRTKQTKSTK